MSTEDEVRNASKQFYTGLNRMVNGWVFRSIVTGHSG